MKKLLTLAMIAMIAVSCNNADTPQSVNQEVNSNSKTNLQARGEGEEIKDPSNLTEEEKAELVEEAITTVKYFTENPEVSEFTTQSGRRAVILCHDNYNASSGNACVYNSSGYLVEVTWYPKQRNNQTPPDAGIQYSGTIVSQCNC